MSVRLPRHGGGDGDGSPCSGCVNGEARVRMANGETKAAKDICIGDVLATPLSPSFGATVQARTIQASGGRKKLVQIGDLVISQPHLVLDGGQWVKPIEVEGAKLVSADVALYNFVTEPVGSSILIEDVVASTLGTHCVGAHDPVRKPMHKLWGSHAIVGFFQQHPTWPNVMLESDDAFLNILKNEAFVKCCLELLGQGRDYRSAFTLALRRRLRDGTADSAETKTCLAVAMGTLDMMADSRTKLAIANGISKANFKQPILLEDNNRRIDGGRSNGSPIIGSTTSSMMDGPVRTPRSAGGHQKEEPSTALREWFALKTATAH